MEYEITNEVAIGAIRLALAGAYDAEAAVSVIRELLTAAPATDGDDTESLKALLARERRETDGPGVTEPRTHEGGIDFAQAERTAQIWAKPSWLPPWINSEPDVFKNLARAYLALAEEQMAEASDG